MMAFPVSLTTAAVAALINLWLAGRVAEMRRQHKVSVGHGENEVLLRRMRAQANFVENAPFFLILLALLEYSGNSRGGLAIVAIAFLAARIAHPFGMETEEFVGWRRFGVLTSFVTTGILAVWALICVGEALLRG